MTDESLDLIEHINRFVDKSGGIEKIRQGIKALSDVDDHQGLLLRLSNSREGSRQLVAAALMGFVLSSIGYKAELKK